VQTLTCLMVRYEFTVDELRGLVDRFNRERLPNYYSIQEIMDHCRDITGNDPRPQFDGAGSVRFSFAFENDAEAIAFKLKWL
jgi:hypothetical protein